MGQQGCCCVDKVEGAVWEAADPGQPQYLLLILHSGRKNAWGIHQQEVGWQFNPGDAAGNAWLGCNSGAFFMGQAVDKGGFSHIGQTNNHHPQERGLHVAFFETLLCGFSQGFQGAIQLPQSLLGVSIHKDGRSRLPKMQPLLIGLGVSQGCFVACQQARFLLKTFLKPAV